MRLGSVLSEALRNIGSGVSRAFAMFLAVLLSGTLLGGYEAMTVIDLESQAVQRINAYVDVNAIVGGTVDGTACDRLSDAGDGITGTLLVRCVPANRSCHSRHPARTSHRMT